MRKEPERTSLIGGRPSLVMGLPGAGTGKGAKAAGYYVLPHLCVTKTSPCTLAIIDNSHLGNSNNLSLQVGLSHGTAMGHMRSKKRSKCLAGSQPSFSGVPVWKS